MGDWRALFGPVDRSVYVDLMAQANFFYGEFPMASEREMARRLGYPPKQFAASLEKLEKRGKISRRTEGSDTVIVIIDWNKHQADYLKKKAGSAEKSDTKFPPRGEEKKEEEKIREEKKPEQSRGSKPGTPNQCSVPVLSLGDLIGPSMSDSSKDFWSLFSSELQGIPGYPFINDADRALFDTLTDSMPSGKELMSHLHELLTIWKRDPQSFKFPNTAPRAQLRNWFQRPTNPARPAEPVK